MTRKDLDGLQRRITTWLHVHAPVATLDSWRDERGMRSATYLGVAEDMASTMVNDMFPEL